MQVITHSEFKKKGKLEFLNNLSTEFLFHGTREGLTNLNPSAPNHPNRKKGVYATDRIEVALFFAITKREKDTRLTYSGTESIQFAASKKIIENIQPGFLYLVKKNQFQNQGHGDWYAENDIEPEYKIEIFPEDFIHDIMAIEDVEVDCKKMKEMFEETYKTKSEVHGIEHINRVVENAKSIAKIECPNQIDDAIMGAYLHDIGYDSDATHKEHAKHSAHTARLLLESLWPKFDTEIICYAVEHHDKGLVTNDPLIGTIWDADRLDLPRLGIKINPNLLSTKTAKKMAKKLSAE